MRLSEPHISAILALALAFMAAITYAPPARSASALSCANLFTEAGTQSSEASAGDIANAVKTIMDRNSRPKVKFETANQLSIDSKLRALKEKVRIENEIGTDSLLNEAIRISGIPEQQIGSALFQSTRLSQLRDYFDFTRSLAEHTGGKIALLSGDESSQLLFYLTQKNGLKFRLVEAGNLGARLEEKEVRAVLVSSKQAQEMAKNEDMLRALKGLSIEVLISDQTHKGINPFNITNANALVAALKMDAAEKALAARDALSKQGLGENVKAVFYDPDQPADKRLSFNQRPHGSISTEEARARIRAPLIDEKKILERLKASGESAENLAQKLNIAITDLQLVSVNKINLMIGTMLEQAKSYAREHGLSEDLYFNIKNGSSTTIARAILKESYGIPESRLLVGKAAVRHLSSKPPMVLMVDDFVGSGDSIRQFVDNTFWREFRDSNGTLIRPSIHPFVIFARKKGLDFLSNYRFGRFESDYEFQLEVPFIGQEVKDVARGYSYRRANKDFGYNAEFNLGLGSTAIGFEYMSPDNNIDGFGPIFEEWTDKNAIKAY